MEPMKVVSAPGHLNDDLANVFRAVRAVGEHFGGVLYRLPARAPLTRSGITELPKGKRHRPSRYRY